MELEVELALGVQEVQEVSQLALEEHLLALEEHLLALGVQQKEQIEGKKQGKSKPQGESNLQGQWKLPVSLPVAVQHRNSPTLLPQKPSNYP